MTSIRSRISSLICGRIFKCGRMMVIGLTLPMALILSGCGSRRVTDSPRTGSEQLIISAAVDTAVQQLDFSFLEDRRVFIDDRYVERLDKPFVVASVRSRAWQAGVIVVSDREECDYVLELRSGAVGVDRTDLIIGIPETAIPSPGGAVALPEAALYKSVRQTGVCRLSFVAYRRDTNEMFYAGGPAYGFADERSWWVFGAGPAIRTNASPERTVDNTSVPREGTAISPEESAEQPE